MSDLTLDLNLTEITKAIKDLEKMMPRLNEAAERLAAQTHTHIVAQVQQKLHSRRQMYLNNLKPPKKEADGLYVIILEQPALWIEYGMPQHSMVDDLLGKRAKTAKDGSRYRVIPMNSSAQTGAAPGTAAASLAGTIKAELRKRKIPFKKLEIGDDGKPKEGILHQFNIEDKPLNRGGPGRGWGHGDVGKVMQGPKLTGSTPFLRGVKVFQKQQNGKWARGFTTFRVVSSKHKGQLWNYPGIEGVKFFDEAEQWAGREWDTKIIPEILADLDIDNSTV